MFQTIVFAYDGSVECQDALEEGILLASRFKARSYLLAIVPELPPMLLATVPISEGLLEDQETYTYSVLEEGLEATGSMKVWKEPGEAIGAFAREIGADLVVLGHHHHSTFVTAGGTGRLAISCWNICHAVCLFQWHTTGRKLRCCIAEDRRWPMRGTIHYSDKETISTHH